MAWMTDTSKVTNTFTVGKVDIEVEESDSEDDPDVDRKNNSYHLIPGEVKVKDPTMTVKAASEESYVRMIMKVEGWNAVAQVIDNNDLGSFFAFLGGWDQKDWRLIGTTQDGNTMNFEFRYKEPVAGLDAEGKAADKVLPALFTELRVPGSLSMEDLNSLEAAGFKMIIEGHAIQSAGFIDAKDSNGNTLEPADAENAAWAAFEVEEKDEE